MALPAWLKEQSLQGLKPGSAEFFIAQKRLIASRPLLKKCYLGWYRLFQRDLDSVTAHAADVLELGSGGSLLHELAAGIITSDVTAGVAERVIDARQLPFGDGALRGIVMSHVLHHIPDVAAFLGEAQRTLAPGGVLSLIEVAHTPFARFFFRRFHPEPYNDRVANWSFAQADTMLDANGALAWIVFVRDAAEFAQRFPGLTIERRQLLPWFGYLLAGGVTMKYLIPRFLIPVISLFEWLLWPLRPLFALHWHITIRKK